MSVPVDDRLARVLLNRIAEPGSLTMHRGVVTHGAVGLVERLLDPGPTPGPGATQSQVEQHQMALDVALRLDAADPDRDLEHAHKLGLRFVIPGDPEWPAALDDLGHAPPLNQRGGVPIGLWLKGPLRLDECVASAAIVGSRSCTTYGADVAAGLGAGLARAGVAVISGAAFGIDMAAHRGALAVEGRAVAVLACGADRVYPQAHRPYLEYLANRGLIVSESCPGAAPMKIRFLSRNRLIAALSRGTVVVEAAVRSGALNTANWAAGLDRVLMGVPGPVTSAASEGVHELIRERNALLVTDATEVLEAIAVSGEALTEPRRAAADLTDRLTIEQRQVLDAVPVGQPVTLQSIARTAGLRESAARTALRRLSAHELVVSEGGRWRQSGVLAT